MILRSIYVAVAALMLAGCGTGSDTASSCEYLSGNLLEDPGFNQLTGARRDRKWFASAHANSKAFTYAADNGTLTITQVGSEPWFLLSQLPDTDKLGGKKIEFTAELKLDLTESNHKHNFKTGGGLAVLAKKNNKIVLRSQLPHDPHMGTHDWFTARIVAKLPPRTNMLRLSFLHQAGGSMQARNPSLRIVDKNCPTNAEPEM
ncbi:hypothetical protein BST95_01955 [Halioglobus japonicus]|uniref:Uncharacterized protein n=1 Tax=Halioglobus japonicus TaxID=930805 RepID=A0AAP8MC47_9GAMM|nr:hypothetical protein [Halioglobus japonicus]AQA17165.1 hypothetical protein BST95_01955 [Halioglobus japonicus]PLW85075.1 hypothetical protein C0029_16220 [Halioglobus japonicus]GHD19345.1 hypothetical protein GCM10007052_27690 [Halioglobus japonicus]